MKSAGHLPRARAACLDYHWAVASEEVVLRTLDVIRRELGAQNAYLEFGGTPRVDPSILSHALDEHWRMVVVFGGPVDLGTMRERLGTLLEAFSGHLPSLEVPSQRLGRPPAERKLDDELLRLIGLMGGKVSLIVDESSPVIWGTSNTRNPHEDVEFLLELSQLARREPHDLKALAEVLATPSPSPEAAPAPSERELERARGTVGPRKVEDWYRSLLASLAVAPFRERKPAEFRGRQVVQPPPVGYVAQTIASQYLVLFVFDEPFSQLHAEATALHAAPYLERLIEELPPVDPTRGGAKLQKIPKLKLV